MTIEEALNILCESHTRDHPELGYEIPMGALPPRYINQSDYVEAWGVVRKHIKFHE